jgi:hypothetical protein
MFVAPDRVPTVPREALRYQGRPAGVITRVVAAILDALVVLALLLSGYGLIAGLAFLVNPLRFSVPRLSWVLNLTAALALAVVYLAAGWSIGGRTCGMALMGLRLAGPRRPARALLRALVCVLFPLGLLWSAVSPRRRSVQDVLLRTEVRYDWHSS